MEQREEADNNQSIESQSNDRTDREGHVAEAEQDVEEDGNQSQDDADDSAASDGLSHRRTYLGRAYDSTLRGILFVCGRCTEVFLGGLCLNQLCLAQYAVDAVLNHVVNHRAVYIVVPVGRDTYGTVSGIAQCNDSGAGGSSGVSALLIVLSKHALEGNTYILNGNLLIEYNNIVTTTSEVDALADTTEEEAYAEYCCSNSPNSIRYLE